MSKRAWTNRVAAAGVMLGLGAAPAVAQQGTTADRDRQTATSRADDQAREATSSTGEKITDAWILTKVKAQFVGEDALENSDINVDVRNNVVILKGTVASQAGKARAAAIASATEGVTRVQNDLRIGVARNHPADGDMKDASKEAKEDTKEAAKDAKRATKDAGAEMREEGREARRDARESAREAKDDAKDAARDAGRKTRETAGTAGQAVNDGWITTKVKSSFVGVDILDSSDINVDTNGHIVTLRGTVPSDAARAKAVSLAKQVDGVTSVKDELKITAKK